MKYSTHVIGGISASGYITTQLLQNNLIHLNVSVVTVFLASSVVGSLLPDIDHIKSFFGHRLIAISATLNFLFGHRGGIHSPFILSLLTGCFVALYHYTNPDPLLYCALTGGLILGAFTHLLLDTLNKQGIPWFYPLSNKRLSVLGIRTGGKLESLLQALFVVINTLYYGINFL